MASLKDTCVIVTGGARGIGKFLTHALYEEGAKIVICSRNEQEVKRVCKDINNAKDIRVFGIVADVSKVQDSKKIVDYAIKKFGRVDVLINNAGVIGEVNEFTKGSPLSWRKAVQVNLFGTVNMTHAVLHHMSSFKAGKIINFAGAGVGGKNLQKNVSSYVTSKFAIAGFTETVAQELSKDNIQINAISPGAINTMITDYMIGKGKKRTGEEMYHTLLKQKETGGDSLNNVSRLALYLCQKKSDYLTGRTLSAKWDTTSKLQEAKTNNNVFKLRRIDSELFYEK